MILTLGLHASPLQAPALSPRLQHAVRLLQMSSLDFSQMLRQSLDTNPFLEADEGASDADTDTDPDADEGGWDTDPTQRPRGEGDDAQVFETLASSATLADHLCAQLTVMPLTLRDRTLALAVAHSLDDDGYLRTPLADLSAAVGLSPAPDTQELSIALRRVQALEPAGVGARDVAECLLLQLAQRPAPRSERAAIAAELAARVAGGHLQALAGGDMAALARQMGATRPVLEEACALIRGLDPRPGWRFGADTAQYLTPDVIVRRRRGQWGVSLNPAVLPRVRLNHSYAELFSRYREPGHTQLGAHLQEARWTLRNVELRCSTILSVARAIVQRQQRFLAYGAMAMKPLALREVADAVGAHESTVSRVTNNKFMATPFGIFELKYFFSRGLATASGGSCSPTAIRSLIREMIAAEPPGQPLSDVVLAQQLAVQGLRVARRTVTKYRQQLRIGAAERRRAAVR